MAKPTDDKEAKQAVVTDEDVNETSTQPDDGAEEPDVNEGWPDGAEESYAPVPDEEPRQTDNPDGEHVPLSSGEAGAYKFVDGKRIRVTDAD